MIPPGRESEISVRTQPHRAGVVGARRSILGILEGEPEVVNAGRIE